MYFVKYGNEYLHDPRVDKCMLLDLSLDCEENSCGYCDFTIYPDHPMYNKIKERDADNPVEVYDDNTLLFAGFIYELGKEFYLDGHVKCKGELDYLSESIVRPYSTLPIEYGNQAPDTIDGYFKWLIEQHNGQVSVNKKFVVGVSQGGALSKYNYIFRENRQYPKTIDEISEKLLNNDNVGGYLRTRHENGIRYIDYLSEWTESNTQILDFGINLTDYTQTDDSADIATFVIPLGAKMKDTNYSYYNGYFKSSDETMDLEKEYYTQSYEQCKKMLSFEEGVTYYEKEVDTFVTSDTSPVEGIDYYTKSEDSDYYTRQDISKFVSGVTYYEQEDYYVVTSDTTPSDDKTYYILRSDSYSLVSELGRFKKHDVYYEYYNGLDESDLSLTITGLTDGETSEAGYIKSGDMIYSESAVRKYGWIGTTYEDADLTEKESLLEAGLLVLKELVSPKRTIEIKAVDMHLVNPSIKPIKVGEYVRVRSRPHGLDSYFLCTSIDLDLNNPENSTYTLGTTFDTLTGQQNKKINELNAAVDKQYETAVALTEEAKASAKKAETTAEKARKSASEASTDASNAKKVASAAIVSTFDEYATTKNPDKAPTEGWSTEPPKYASDTFIWKRTTAVYGDKSSVTGKAILITGNTGAKGEDAYSIILTSEAYTFVGGTNGVGSGVTCSTQAIAFCGTNQCTSVNVAAKDIVCPIGIGASVSNSGTNAVTITFITTAVVSTACEATIPVTVDGITVNKKFSFAVAMSGVDGTSVSVSSTEVTYQISPSGTAVPSGEWSSDIPAITNGQYLWTKTYVKYSDGKSTTSYSVSYNGTNGTSVGVSSSIAEYQTSTSGTTVPTGDWSTSVPSVAEGQFLWTRTTVTYSDDKKAVSYSVSYKGANGKNGADAITMSITSSNSTVFKNNSDSTILTAHAYVAGVEQIITDAGVCDPIGSVKWYKSGSATAIATAKTLTVSANDIINSEAYTCQLEE